MPGIETQAQFQRWPKPTFCYLCGGALGDGSLLNSDHCPPQGMFAAADRINYPLKIKVHAQCNHRWHGEDEKMAVFFDVLHGAQKASDPALRKKLKFVEVTNDQGTYQGITEFPIRPLAHRIIRCAHAVLYGSHLPANTPNQVHYPIPEVDQGNGNKPMMHLPQTYAFADALYKAQKTKTHDFLTAYNGKFRFVCTWSKLSSGQPICIFAFDIYRLSSFGIRIKDFPRAVIGFYAAETPSAASMCSGLETPSSDNEILYPIL